MTTTIQTSIHCVPLKPIQRDHDDVSNIQKPDPLSRSYESKGKKMKRLEVSFAGWKRFLLEDNREKFETLLTKEDRKFA